MAPTYTADLRRTNLGVRLEFRVLSLPSVTDVLAFPLADLSQLASVFSSQDLTVFEDLELQEQKLPSTTNPECRGGPLAMRLVTIVLLALVLIVCASLSRRKAKAAVAMHDCASANPFCGSEVGNTLTRACGNCHSNQTDLPWYGHVPPISWWIRDHVHEARKQLNFADWRSYSARQRRDELQSICGVVMTGRMPPSSYTTMHSEAKLKAQEKDAVCAWTTIEIDRDK